MKKLLVIISCWCMIGGFVLLSFNPVAATAVSSFNKGLTNTASSTGHSNLTDWQPNKLPSSVGKAIAVVLGLLGIVFLGLIIYGGFIWMLARGNEQDITKARDLIISAIIGLIIIFGAYAITVFISIIWEKVI